MQFKVNDCFGYTIFTETSMVLKNGVKNATPKNIPHKTLIIIRISIESWQLTVLYTPARHACHAKKNANIWQQLT